MTSPTWKYAPGDPNLEALVAAEPDLIISVSAFSKYDAQIKELARHQPRAARGAAFDQNFIREVTTRRDLRQGDEAKKLTTSTPRPSARRSLRRLHRHGG